MSQSPIDRRTAMTLMAASALAAASGPAMAQDGAALSLTAEWSGPYGGLPPFDKVDIKLFEAAYDAAMASQRREIAVIVANREAPTFANTIVPYERSGRAMNRVGALYGVWNGNLSTPELQEIGKTITPKLAAFSDEIIQNPKLFARIKAVWDNKAQFNLTPEQDRLLWLYYTNFVRAGAALSPKAKTRVAAINKDLSLLFKSFSDNLLHDEEQVLIVTEAELEGLSEGLKASMKQADGSYAIANTRSAMEPVTTFCTNRALREKVWRAYVNRGDNGDAYDNNAAIAKILKLRFERAQLRGYETHAHWRLENAMAKTPQAALGLLEAVWGPAVARVKEEVADMQAIADKEGAKENGKPIMIAPWDYRFYAEKVRKARYDLDENEVKPYLQLEKLREGMMWAAGEIFGFSFVEVSNVPVFHPDVRVWKVTRASKTIGLFYFDPYARKGKRSGAWMNAYRAQHRMDGTDVLTLVSNNCNYLKPAPGEAVLISWEDASTLFHEFGHAIHGLLSDVTYPSLAGTNVARDYVEFPSQLNEHWLPTREVLSRFALHYQTGEVIPQALVEKIEKADTFNQGFATVEYLASALIDMKLHLAGGADIDADAFEREELSKLGMPKEIVMRHRTPQFSHVFSSDGYSAGYYSYLWSDVLTADAAEAFTEASGFYDKAVADRLRSHILSVGNTVDPAEGYRAFRGRDPNRDALMRKRGFPVT